jgi:uncharacterized protein (TIGR02001 family)
MKAIRTLALLTGLLVLSGVSQAQFSSTWTAVSDYDFRGFSQTAKNPALQASADVTLGESGFSMGAWASNVDFDNDEDVELDLYINYAKEINEHFTFVAGGTYYDYPLGGDLAGYPEFYIGADLGNFGIKQWYSDDFYAGGDTAMYTELNYSQPIGEKFSLDFHAGYSYGDYWKNTFGDELVDYAVQANYTFGNFTVFAKFTGTDGSDSKGSKIEDDVSNNEPRGLIGITTTFPWGK